MKKLKKWAIGFFLLMLSTVLCMYTLIFPIKIFINMMNSTGKEFVGYFIGFIIGLLFFVFLPYLFYRMIEDGVEQKWK